MKCFLVLVYIDKDLHVLIIKSFNSYLCVLIIDENMKIADFFLRVNTAVNTLNLTIKGHVKGLLT